jgi:hypothetical protein
VTRCKHMSTDIIRRVDNMKVKINNYSSSLSHFSPPYPQGRNLRLAEVQDGPKATAQV